MSMIVPDFFIPVHTSLQKVKDLHGADTTPAIRLYSSMSHTAWNLQVRGALTNRDGSPGAFVVATASLGVADLRALGAAIAAHLDECGPTESAVAEPKPDTTPEPSSALRMARCLLAEAQETIDAHRAKYQHDALEGLHWVSSLAQAAATVHVFTKVTEAFEAGRTQDAVMVFAREELLRLGSLGAPRSSGFLDGELHAEVIRAWTRVLTLL